MLSSFGMLTVFSIVLASCGAGLTAYNIFGFNPRTTTFWTLAGPSLLAFGFGLLILAFSMIPHV